MRRVSVFERESWIAGRDALGLGLAEVDLLTVRVAEVVCREGGRPRHVRFTA
jgi:hypothetical protein